MSKDLDIQKAIDQFQIEQTHSTQVQIMLEFRFLDTVNIILKWLGVKSGESKNKSLKEAVFVLQQLSSKHEKVLKDLRHYEGKASYYEMKYKSAKQSETLLNNLMDRGLIKI